MAGSRRRRGPRTRATPATAPLAGLVFRILVGFLVEFVGFAAARDQHDRVAGSESEHASGRSRVEDLRINFVQGGIECVEGLFDGGLDG